MNKLQQMDALPPEYQLTRAQRVTVKQEWPSDILPSQVKLTHHPSGERAVWAAVLYHALNDAVGKGIIDGAGYRNTADERADLSAAAYRWLDDTTDESIGSFIWICHTLQLDPEYLLKKIHNPKNMTEWRRRHSRTRGGYRPQASNDGQASRTANESL